MLELSLNLGDGRGQAAAAGAFGLTTSIPSVNLTPRVIFGNWLWPSRRRQLFSAASASLKIMASAVLFERSLGAHGSVTHGRERAFATSATVTRPSGKSNSGRAHPPTAHRPLPC